MQRLRGRDDLLLCLDAGERRLLLLIAPGGQRARLGLTQRRFPRERFDTGPRVDQVRGILLGAGFQRAEQPSGERRASLTFRHPDRGRLSLEIELFGNRGLWALLDGGGRCLELSRLPAEKERHLAPGAAYVPPRSRPAVEAVAPRFAPPVLASVDAHYTALDLAEEAAQELATLERALTGAIKRLRHKADGLAAQQREIEEAPRLRREADLLLAYSFQIPRGASLAEVPDPDHDGQTLRIPLDPAQAVRQQIEARYDRARRLEDSALISAEREREVRRELAELEAMQPALAADAPASVLADLGAELRRRGLLAKAQGGEKPERPADPKLAKVTRGENFRTFRSSEGFTILAGKSNEQNDRLSLRVAAGNDLWFHVGQGYAGSHVVMRLPRNKTASLESLLDAAHVALHFSKARGVPVCDVHYTFAKHVRKPKGLPAGKVTISQEKTLRVRFEQERLARLLAGSGEDTS